MLHGKSMAGFVVLNNMANDVMENEELMVFSTNIIFTILYFVYGAMHVCNYSQRSYTVVCDTSIIHSVVRRRSVVQPCVRDQPSKKNYAYRIMQRNHA
jgi:hypothetical protein